MRIEKNLIIAAHPDDEVIGCSSVLKNSIVFMFSNPDPRRMGVFDEICDDLDIKSIKFDLKSLEFDTYGTRHLLGLLESAYEYVSKEYHIVNVFGHYLKDFHQDHQALAKATDIFCRRRTKDFKAYYQYFTDNNFPIENVILNPAPDKFEFLNRYPGINNEHLNYLLDFSRMLQTKYQVTCIPEPFICKYRIGL